MKKFLYLFYLILFLILIPAITEAQCGPEPGADPDAPFVACPIDDGIVLLIAAAIGITIKKYLDNKKRIVF